MVTAQLRQLGLMRLERLGAGLGAAPERRCARDALALKSAKDRLIHAHMVCSKQQPERSLRLLPGAPRRALQTDRLALELVELLLGVSDPLAGEPGGAFRLVERKLQVG